MTVIAIDVGRCEIVTVRSRVIAALNAAPAGSWVSNITLDDDNRRNTSELTAIILAADARICAARAARAGDGYRSLFLSPSFSIAHGGIIPAHLGPIEQVTIKYATTDTEYKAGKFDPLLTLSDIERWRANPGGRYGPNHDAPNSIISGFYVRRGSQIFYTGADLKCQIANFVRTNLCQAPDTDEDMLVGLALGDALKEGDTGPMLQTLIADARAEYAELLKREPNPSETMTLAA